MPPPTHAHTLSQMTKAQRGQRTPIILASWKMVEAGFKSWGRLWTQAVTPVMQYSKHCRVPAVLLGRTVVSQNWAPFPKSFTLAKPRSQVLPPRWVSWPSSPTNQGICYPCPETEAAFVLPPVSLTPSDCWALTRPNPTYPTCPASVQEHSLIAPIQATKIVTASLSSWSLSWTEVLCCGRKWGHILKLTSSGEAIVVLFPKYHLYVLC